MSDTKTEKSLGQTAYEEFMFEALTTYAEEDGYTDLRTMVEKYGLTSARLRELVGAFMVERKTNWDALPEPAKELWENVAQAVAQAIWADPTMPAV